MEFLTDFLHQLRDVEGLIRWGGLAMVCAIVFAETGLLVGFFLPGDSLLFTAGFLAAGGHINIALLLVLATFAAITGDQVGYFIGYKTGARIFHRPDSRFFKREHLLRTRRSTRSTAARRSSSRASCRSCGRSRRWSPASR